MAANTISIGPLRSGGLMLTYRCTNACRHCLYRCSPKKPDEFLSEEGIDRTFDALSKERGLYGIHLAGGEATLNFSRLLYAIRSARRHRVALDYLETNADWCIDKKTARDGFRQMQKAGLDAVLISASLFHNEFTPLERTKAAIRAATEVFGHGGVLVWTAEVLRAMEQNLDETKKHPLPQSCQKLGLDPASGDLWRLHSYLTPGGRAAERLADGLPRNSVESFAENGCGSILRETSHFHIDPYGNLFTGHCPGLSIGNVENFHRQVTREEAPVYWTLYHEGPFGLWRKLATDFVPEEAGYVSKCHFCLELRKFLFEKDAYAELRPAAFYG